MKTRSIVVLVVVAVFVLSAALPAFAGAKAPAPFHDPDSPAFAKVHAKYNICAKACHKGVSGHALCGVCHDLVAQCGACHAIPE